MIHWKYNFIMTSIVVLCFLVTNHPASSPADGLIPVKPVPAAAAG